MKKDKRIAIRLSEDEYKILKEKSENHGLTISRFLRDLSLNYPITCITDQIAAHKLLQVAADMGRLGGLFKFWLTWNEDEKKDFSKRRTFEDIDELVDQILELQKILKTQALKIIKHDN